MREFISGFKILPFYTTEASESKDRLLCGNCSRKGPTVIVSFSLFLQRYTHMYIYILYICCFELEGVPFWIIFSSCFPDFHLASGPSRRLPPPRTPGYEFLPGRP